MKKKSNKYLYVLCLIVVIGCPVLCSIISLITEGFSDFFDSFFTMFFMVPAIGFGWGFLPFIVITILYIFCFIYVIYSLLKKSFKKN